MTELNLITLPERDDMLARLTAIDDEQHLVRRFYPKILKAAGQQRAAGGVVMLVQLAIVDYMEGMPAVLGQVMMLRRDQFVLALIDDETARAEAIEFMAEVDRTTAA
jgi:hypothetical protein